MLVISEAEVIMSELGKELSQLANMRNSIRQHLEETVSSEAKQEIAQAIYDAFDSLGCLHCCCLHCCWKHQHEEKIT
jgi:predicted helicase